MKNLSSKASLLLVFCLFIFSSCLTSKKLTENIITANIGKDLSKNKRIEANNIILTADTLSKMNEFVSIKKNKSYFIPAIVFWVWENSLNCEINNLTFRNSFIDIINYKTQEFQLSKHLGTKTLEITIRETPSKFKYINKGFFYFVVYAYGYSFFEGIQPERQSLEITYRIFENNFEIKSNSFIRHYDKPFNDRWLSSSKLVNKYIFALNQSFENDCNEFMTEIIDSL